MRTIIKLLGKVVVLCFLTILSLHADYVTYSGYATYSYSITYQNGARGIFPGCTNSYDGGSEAECENNINAALNRSVNHVNTFIVGGTIQYHISWTSHKS